jgi:protein-S-isoprenylcysteine O-methyltransferase Ste14
MVVLMRALTYATAFIGLVLIFVPARVLEWSGVTRPARLGPVQAGGLGLVVVGGGLALWCVLTFALVGRGTPAPFDPPRRLVVAGPYGWIRNPMYVGAGTALLGAALWYESTVLAGYGGVFFVVTHLFVVLYEEPTLRRTFGESYADYCRRVGRWLPRRRPRSARPPGA